jgi:hypothetical protein
MKEPICFSSFYVLEKGVAFHMGENQGVDSHSLWYPLVFIMRTKYLFKNHPTFNVET